jgi:hypothetical protein
MKDGFVLFLICAVAIGGIVSVAAYINYDMLRAAGPAPGPGITSEAIVPAEPEPEPEPASVPVHKPLTKPAVVKPAAVAEIAPTVPPVVLAPPPAPAPAPAWPFPLVGEIAVGIPQNTITREYGDPVLTATTSDHGHVLETMVYAREGAKEMTVISLEDGKVSAAHSRSEGAPALAAPAAPARRGE